MLTDDRVLTTAEILQIMEECSKLGVASFSYGALKLEFNAVPSRTFSTPLAAPEHEKQTREALEHDELEAKREQIELSLIENPALAEQLLASGDLVDGDDYESDED